MKQERDYIEDLAEIRSMMERTSKFLSLSGWAGILVGLYALAAAYVAKIMLGFNPDEVMYSLPVKGNSSNIFVIATGLLFVALCTALFFSYYTARKRGEKAWNATSRRMLINMGVPLVVGGFFILIMFLKGATGLMMPLSLIFYGLALFNAAKFTYGEVRIMGFVYMASGLLSVYFLEYSLLLWAFGFGVVHIIYGLYMHFKYER
ncbi:hypothetical protein [Arundinibacter roseus]|uniref:Uncharacterized protein n=1 Tax=Arundinibacter roseus TaxID=2070510 RepID=A0A4R4KHM2_9BACT|nr:hypothetical protein [Arundinibacter roseus]TDB67558.1 hypothetical protein EZE20_06345 [Arundinibacter roseus]